MLWEEKNYTAYNYPLTTRQGNRFTIVWTSFLGHRPRLFPLHPAANQYATFENYAEIKWTLYVQGFSIDKREAGGINLHN